MPILNPLWSCWRSAQPCSHACRLSSYHSPCTSNNPKLLRPPPPRSVTAFPVLLTSPSASASPPLPPLASKSPPVATQDHPQTTGGIYDSRAKAGTGKGQPAWMMFGGVGHAPVQKTVRALRPTVLRSSSCRPQALSAHVRFGRSWCYLSSLPWHLRLRLP